MTERSSQPEIIQLAQAREAHKQEDAVGVPNQTDEIKTGVEKRPF